MLAIAALLAATAAIITTFNPHHTHVHANSELPTHRGVYRLERTAAVWGDTAPDYSAVQLESTEGVFFYALLFVDLKISDYYRRDPVAIKTEVMKLVHEANKYFYQVGVHLVIVDVIESWRNDFSLYTFEEYRNKRIHDLPYHNFAALLSYRYAGGLAFVNGMCSIKSVMLSGFYPHHPEAMGSIFFHEVSHLVGVPHTPFNQTLNVPNCTCEQNLPDPQDFSQPVYRPRSDLGPGVENNDFASNSSTNNNDLTRPDEPRHHYTPLSHGCLRIPGFDHNCTLQLMANLLWRNRCLLREPYNGLNDHTRRMAADEEAREVRISTVPLCGNGHREEGEECDCGLEKSCWLANCDPKQCARLMPQWIVWMCIVMVSSAALISLSAAYHYHLLRRRITKFPYVKPNDRLDVFGRVVGLLDDHLPSIRCDSLFDRRGYGRAGMAVRLIPLGRRAPSTLRAQNMSFSAQHGGSKGAPMSLVSFRGAKLDASSIVVIRSPTGCRTPTETAHSGLAARAKRPGLPPPPPPPSSSTVTRAATMPRVQPQCVISPSNITIPIQSLTLPRRPTIPPPPHPSTIPVHSLDDVNRIENVSEECRLKKPSATVLLNRLRSPPTRVEEDRFSISHKFADFDDEEDEFDSDFDENFATQDS